jgi:hypothetical protein
MDKPAQIQKKTDIAQRPIDPVEPHARKSKRSGPAWLVRIRVYNGDAATPKFRLSVPLPLFFCFSLFFDLFTFIALHIAAVVLYFAPKTKNRPFIWAIMRAVRSRFLLTRLSFALMRYGKRLEVCAIDGDDGVVVYGT